MLNNKEDYFWIDEKINNDFRYDEEVLTSSTGSEQLLIWFLKILKDEKKTNLEICDLVNRLFEEIRNKFNTKEDPRKPLLNADALRYKIPLACFSDIWCGNNPNDHTVSVIFMGIVRVIYIDTVINFKENMYQEWLKNFIVDNPLSYTEDPFTQVFPAIIPSDDPNNENNLFFYNKTSNISCKEVDENTENWTIKFWLSQEENDNFFKNYSWFKDYARILKGSMIDGINETLGFISKAVLSLEPKGFPLPKEEIERIVGKKYQIEKENINKETNVDLIEYKKLLSRLINKYYEKAFKKWTNVKKYNPYHGSFTNSDGKIKISKYERIASLLEAIEKAIESSSSEKLDNFLLGKSSAPIEHEFSKDDLVLLTNFDDYLLLKTAEFKRNGKGFIKLSDLGIKFVYPLLTLERGCARLIDKNAFRIHIYFETTHIQPPSKFPIWRFQFFYPFAITMFSNFCGCLFVPDWDTK